MAEAEQAEQAGRQAEQAEQAVYFLSQVVDFFDEEDFATGDFDEVSLGTHHWQTRQTRQTWQARQARQVW